MVEERSGVRSFKALAREARVYLCEQLRREPRESRARERSQAACNRVRGERGQEPRRGVLGGHETLDNHAAVAREWREESAASVERDVDDAVGRQREAGGDGGVVGRDDEEEVARSHVAGAFVRRRSPGRARGEERVSRVVDRNDDRNVVRARQRELSTGSRANRGLNFVS